MWIYNTQTRKKEEFQPLHEGKVGIYACGPTVYNYIHIGNARPLIVFDVLRRYLEWRGYDVTFVQNFTDIDDKMINRANEEGTTVKALGERFIAEYFQDVEALGVRRATVHPKATEHIPEILALVQKLMDKGLAYKSTDGVYFDTEAFRGYGKLSGQNLEDLESGARIQVDENKKHPMDFALWKARKEGEPYWESPFGEGRPGWHIECSAMARKHLGDTIDLHCGGVDLVFPHHENEIAQSECANGCSFARYWMHNGYINVDNKKMSKSLGNFFTVRDVAEQMGYEPIRFFLISSSYRSPINYNAEIIGQGKAALDRLYTCRSALDDAEASAPEGAADAAFAAKCGERREQFIAAMDDDLNTADAIAALFELTKDINVLIASGGPSKGTCRAARTLFGELCGVLGLLYDRKEEELDAEIEALIAARTAARQNKNWAEADRIRDDLKARKIVLEDTPQGVKWHKA